MPSGRPFGPTKRYHAGHLSAFLGVMVSPETRGEVAAQAERQRTTSSQIVRRAIKGYIVMHEPERPDREGDRVTV